MTNCQSKKPLGIGFLQKLENSNLYLASKQVSMTIKTKAIHHWRCVDVILTCQKCYDISIGWVSFPLLEIDDIIKIMTQAVVSYMQAEGDLDLRFSNILLDPFFRINTKLFFSQFDWFVTVIYVYKNIYSIDIKLNSNGKCKCKMASF